MSNVSTFAKLRGAWQQYLYERRELAAARRYEQQQAATDRRQSRLGEGWPR